MLTRSGLCPARAFTSRFPTGVFAPCSSTIASFATPPQPTRRPQLPRGALASRGAIRNTSSAPSQPVVAGASSPQHPLTWNDFFVLRRTRRRIGQACSGVGAIGVTYYGLTYMIRNGWDSALSAQLGLDPFMLMGLSTFGMMAVGWLVGPVFGNQVFNLTYRGVLKEFSRKDSAFFNRIKQQRVDPTASSIANPPPDYYGEKIGSVTGYRRWLKDQRAFNLKTGRHRARKSR